MFVRSDGAEPLGLSARAFDLGDPARVDAAIKDVSVVLCAAGPFSATSRLTSPTIAGSWTLTRLTSRSPWSGQTPVMLCKYLHGLNAKDTSPLEVGVSLHLWTSRSVNVALGENHVLG
jgi:hypothetical protein